MAIGKLGNLFILFCALTTSVFNSCDSYANQSFYKEHARGWHWYEKQAVEEEPAPNPTPPQTPTEQVAAIRQDAENKLHQALMKPTEENVISYIRAQSRIGDRSEEFSKIWQRVVYKNPSLDTTIKNPVSSNALHIARKDENAQKKEKIKSLSKEYGLMYFFRGDCQYCQEFSEIVKRFAKSYNWELMPIQIGNVSSHEFFGAKMDNGIAARLGITKVPALIAVHPKTGDMVPLAFSYIAEDEIEDRVNALVGNVKLTEQLMAHK